MARKNKYLYTGVQDVNCFLQMVATLSVIFRFFPLLQQEV